jgi:hypothetical protein
MSAIRALERMLAAGVPLQDAIEIAKGFEADVAEYVAALARELSRDPKAEARKAKDRDRKRKSEDSAEIHGNPRKSTEEPAAPLTCAQVVTPSSSLRSEEKDPPVTSIEVTAPKGANTTRGTRLPENWTPDEDGWTYAANTLGLNVDPANELDRFRDYWRAVPGAKGRKTDWPATWRNWVRRAAETLPRKAHERPYADAKLAARQANMARAAEGALRVVEAARRDRDHGPAADPFWTDPSP